MKGFFPDNMFVCGILNDDLSEDDGLGESGALHFRRGELQKSGVDLPQLAVLTCSNPETRR